jgi:hypothetical protein
MESVSDVRSKQSSNRVSFDRKRINHRYSQALNKRLWIKAQLAVGQSDLHRQNKDRAMCLISGARAAHEQL